MSNWKDRVELMLLRTRDLACNCTICPLGRSKCVERDVTFDPHVFSNMKASRWMVIGQNPGFNECIQGEPFVGDSGEFFNQILTQNDISRDDLYISNAVKCHTMNNEKPSSEHMQRCEPILRLEIAILRPILILALGAVAFEVFCPEFDFTPNLGKIIFSKRFNVKVFPVYHPSPRNMKTPEKCNKFIKDLTTFCRVVKAYNQKNSNS